MTQYTKAPIVEAVIELRVTPRSDVRAESLRELPLAGFRRVGDLKRARFELRADEPQSTSETEIVGYRFQSEDQQRVVLVQTESFTFSFLAPYDEWQSFKRTALAAWPAYSSIVSPQSVNRIGLRYINQLEVPEVAGYFNIYPVLPSALAATLPAEYFVQARVPPTTGDYELLVNSSASPVPNTGLVRVLLDIDAYTKIPLAADHAGIDEQISARLDDLRARKNEAFESLITDKTRRLIR